MKKLILFFALGLFLFSCSGDSNTNNVAIEKFKYEIKKTFEAKVVSKEGNYSFMGTSKYRSYTIDTLEINLNPNPYLGFAITLELAQIETITQPSTNDIKTHVNYINFINLKPIWTDNKHQTVFAKARYSGQPETFSYSESNINISKYPKLFSNGNNYITLEIKPKIVYDLEILNSDNDYFVGQEIFYKNHYYKIVSKGEN